MIVLKTVILLFVVCHWNQAKDSQKSRLWIIAYDGIRWDFLNRIKLPNFQWFIDNGISAKWMEPVFLTRTFPACFSMATGLYVENHGIVSNAFYDNNLNKTFTWDSAGDEAIWWSKGEPIWITATNNKIKSGVSQWPGGDVVYNGVKPEHSVNYTAYSNSESGIDEVIRWFLSGTRLVNFYYDQPDDEIHKHGPNSKQADEELKRVDQLLGYAIHQLKSNNLFDNTNIIIVSDHGFEEVKKTIYLNSLNNYKFDISLIKRVYSNGTWFNFDLNDDLSESTINQYLNDLEKYLGKNYKLYKSRDAFPNYWHYRGPPERIGNFSVQPNPGYLLFLDEQSQEQYKKKGEHGYDSKLENMKPIFLAYGPDFQNKPRKVKEVHQVDIYGLALKLLQIDHISPKNGSRSRINEIIYGK